MLLINQAGKNFSFQMVNFTNYDSVEMLFKNMINLTNV